jgi:HlyD family secretion protein
MPISLREIYRSWLPFRSGRLYSGRLPAQATVSSDFKAEEPSQTPFTDQADTPGIGAGYTPDLLDDDFVDTRSKSGLRWILASGFVLIAALGGWWGYTTWQRRTADPLMVTTATPMRETLENRVDASGVVTLGNQTTLTAPDDVTVEAVLVAERQAVAAGDVLLRLRDRALEQQLDEKLIQATILELDYQRRREILQERQRDVQRAEDRLAESQELAAEGYIPEDEVDTDRDALETAQSELRAAQIELQTKDLERQQNQAAINSLRARMADNNIVAPFDAVVLNIDVSPGDGIPREGKLLTIGDPTQEMVQFDLIALDAGKVSVNMPVRVGMIGPNPQKYDGRVVSIAPQAVLDDGNNSGQASVQAIARLNEPSGVLIPGSSVSVEVILQQQEDVLAVPLGTIQTEGDRTYVWVIDAEGRAQKRDVTPGLETLDAIEIASGLEEDDQIIVNFPPDQELTEGQEVVPAGNEGMMPEGGL